MSRIQHLKEKRDKDVIEYYHRKEAEKVEGTQVQKYRHRAILAMASAKFYLAEDTIERIVSGNNLNVQGDASDPDQISIFDQGA